MHASESLQNGWRKYHELITGTFGVFIAIGFTYWANVVGNAADGLKQNMSQIISRVSMMQDAEAVHEHAQIVNDMAVNQQMTQFNDRQQEVIRRINDMEDRMRKLEHLHERN